MAPSALLAMLLLSACTGAADSASTPTSTPAETPTSSPSPTPEPVEEIVLSMGHLQYTHDGVTDTVALEDAAGVLALFEGVTGTAPTATEPDPDIWYLEGTMAYDWSAVHVNLSSAEDMRFAWVVVSAPEVGGVVVRTVEGVSVGATREEALAAGAREGFDSDGDGDEDYLEIGRQEVPGTTSYINGGVGILFVMLTLEGGVVSGMSSPANDFSDL